MSDKEQARAGSAGGSEGGPPWLNAVTLIFLGVFVLHLGLRYLPALAGHDWPKEGGLDLVAVALLALAAMPTFSAYLASAKLPGGFEVAFREVQRKQHMAREEINRLRFIVEGFVTEGELKHLRNIQSNEEYRPKAEDLVVLDGELRRLLALRLIERRGGLSGVRTFAVADGQGRRIGDWFRLTRRGLEYLAMLEPEGADAGR